jgi:hypothetical protein
MSAYLMVASESIDPPSRKLFVVGDSISMHYGPYLEDYLRGTLEYDRKRDNGGATEGGVPEGANGGDSGMVLHYLTARSKDPSFRPDILLVNCGLHDIKRNLERNKSLQVPLGRYRENLQSIHVISREIGARLIWVRSTPVVDTIHNQKGRTFYRYAADLDAYNRVADEFFAGVEVPVIDLYTFTARLGNRAFIDHVHYDQETRALQAAYIAGFLQEYLSSSTR